MPKISYKLDSNDILTDGFFTPENLAVFIANLVGLSGTDNLTNTIFVSKGGDDLSGDINNISKPFLTVNKAESVATSGDLIIIFPGDYSGESDLGGVEGVTYWGLPEAKLPGFDIAQGDLDSEFIRVIGYINGNVTIDQNQGEINFSQATINGNLNIVHLDNEKNTFGDITGFINSDASCLTVNSFGTYCVADMGGPVPHQPFIKILNANPRHQPMAGFPQSTLKVSHSVACYVYNSTLIYSGSDHVDDSVVDLNTSGKVYMENTKLIYAGSSATTQAAGIKLNGSFSGSLQLKDCVIQLIDDANETYAITSDSNHSVYIQGVLNVTHDSHINIDFEGLNPVINLDFESPEDQHITGTIMGTKFTVTDVGEISPQDIGASKIVDFPATNTDSGVPGDIAFGTVSGIEWLAVYSGDGITHSWIFSPFQTAYPS